MAQLPGDDEPNPAQVCPGEQEVELQHTPSTQ
jgi:hypothetical protein